MKNETTPVNAESATLGGGCFWCLEAVYELVRGVQKVVSGYAGGESPNPTYREVCSGTTGHAEVVNVHFDPASISFEAILAIFFSSHNPTTLNRQGADVGTQYRSVIFYHSENQRETAEKLIRKIETDSKGSLKIVTQLLPVPTFFPAEDYHQGYFRNHPEQGYCQAVIEPKVVKLRKQFADWLQNSEPA